MADKEDPEQPRIDVQSYSQQGGITAGIVNIQGIMPAQAQIAMNEHKQTSDGYFTRCELAIIAQYAIPRLEIASYSPTLLSMAVRPLGLTGVYSAVEGAGTARNAQGVEYPARFFETQNAGGKWNIETITERDEIVGIEVRQL
jgi:hypothetical protein